MKNLFLLKLALFSFLCSIICTVGLVITNISFIALAILFFVVLSVGALVAWVCTLIFHKFRYSLNVIVIIVTFVSSVILGLITTQTTPLSAINDYENMSLFSIMFVISSLGCLISIIVLLGRYIFSKDKSSKSTATPVGFNVSAQSIPYQASQPIHAKEEQKEDTMK